MNIAKIMIPKISTVFLHEKDTIRQGLERFMVHGYTAVPVLNDQEQYIGSVTEGDFLRHLLVCQTTDLKVLVGLRPVCHFTADSDWRHGGYYRSRILCNDFRAEDFFDAAQYHAGGDFSAKGRRNRSPDWLYR